MENTENKQETPVIEFTAMVQKAVDDAVVPIIAEVAKFKESTQQDDSLNKATKQWLDAKDITQPTPNETEGLSNAVKQWLQHKVENRDSGKEL